MRPIDADALIKEICSNCALFLDKTCDGNRISCYPISIVREQPTIDVVPDRRISEYQADMFAKMEIENKRLQAEVEELTEKVFVHSSAAMENLKEVERLNNLLDLNTQRCEALRDQLRDSHECYEKHLNEIESQVPHWIPVTERLPDFHEEVLIYAIGKEDGFSPVVAISEIYIFRLLPFSNGTIEWRDPWDFFSKNYEVTHWMPLPKAPEVAG